MIRYRTLLLIAFIAAALAWPDAADAQRKRRRKRRNAKPAPAETQKRDAGGQRDDTHSDADRRSERKATPPRAQVMDFTGLQLSGRLRTPQLLYFLDRVDEELERASLERRSFIPAMTRSLQEDGL